MWLGMHSVLIREVPSFRVSCIERFHCIVIVSYNLTGNIHWVVTVSTTRQTLHTPVEKVRYLGIPCPSLSAPASSGSIITEKRSIFVEKTPNRGNKHKDM